MLDFLYEEGKREYENLGERIPGKERGEFPMISVLFDFFFY